MTADLQPAPTSAASAPPGSHAVGRDGLFADTIPALALVGPPRALRKLAAWLVVLFALAAAALVLLPWTQNVSGKGPVVALDPTLRPMMLDAPVSGRIVEWHVWEGQRVEAGDQVVAIRDLDPDRLERFGAQLDDTRAQLAAATEKQRFMQQVVDGFIEAREAKIEGATFKLEAVRQKLVAQQAGVRAAEATLTQKSAKRQRMQNLVAKGTKSRQDLEIDRRDEQEAQQKLAQAKAYVAGAEQDISAARADLEGVRREQQAKVDKARGELEDVKGKAAELSVKLAELDSKIAKQRTQEVVAPVDGVIQKVIAGQGQEIVKSGDKLAVLVPDADRRVVELKIDGMHVPLVRAGRPVRLMFEGWPAIQFSGWPETSVGTFAGRVRFVDRNADETGKFRVQVEPTADDDSRWPDAERLRQGSRAQGWILLDEVTLGYELWRQLNGFPAVMPSERDGKPPKVKLPK